MSGENVLLKAVLFTGLLLLTTGASLILWTLMPCRKIIIGGPGFHDYKPGVTYFRRYYGYYLEETIFSVTVELPGIQYNFTVTRVGGDWKYSRCGIGHDYFEFRLPGRGVYEIDACMRVVENSSSAKTGSINVTVDTWRGSSIFSTGMGLIIPGCLLVSIALLAGRLRNVF